MSTSPPEDLKYTVADEFRILGLSMAGKPTGGSISRQERHFKSFFGTSWVVCADAWLQIFPDLIGENKFLKKKHMLWGLLFLKMYHTETVHSGMVGCDEKTFSKWVWKILTALADLDVELVSQTTIYLKILPFLSSLTLLH